MRNRDDLKWTDTAYKLLYEKLVKQFGAYETWEKTHSPGRGLDEKYKAFLEAFAIVVEAESARAVAHEVSFIPQALSGENIDWAEPGRARRGVTNVNAAYFAGFVENNVFPSLNGQSVANRRAQVASMQVASTQVASTPEVLN